MGNNLAKTPLTAIIFAALLMFLAVFMPFSQGYSAARAELAVPLLGYLFMIVYGLLISLATAVIFSGSLHKGITLILFTLIPLFISQWLVPLLPQIVFGEVTKVMTQADSLFELARGLAVSLLFLILFYLLRTPEKPLPPGAPPKKPDEKYNLKLVNLLIMLIVLPVIYMTIYFLVRYLVLWRVEAVRVYYTGDGTQQTFIQNIINMLLQDGKQVPMSLIKGFLYAVSLIPLLFQLASKRMMFIITSVMLFLGAAVQMLIPSPVMPIDIQRAHLVPLLIELTLYSALSAFLLHLCIRKDASAKPGIPPAAAGQRPVPKAAPNPPPPPRAK